MDSVTTTDLVEVRIGFRLSNSIEILHVDELKVVGETWVGSLKLGLTLNMRQVPKLLIAPVIEITQTAIYKQKSCVIINKQQKLRQIYTTVLKTLSGRIQ